MLPHPQVVSDKQTYINQIKSSALDTLSLTQLPPNSGARLSHMSEFLFT